MALFGNDNKKTIEELENYYSNKTPRTGMAWAMAFLSLLITVTVLGGLFFGGRWLYRSITDGDGQTIATTSGVTSPVSSNNDNENDDVAIIDGTVTDEAASTSDTTTQASSDDSENSDSDETTTAVAGVSTELPNTGAGNVLVALPAVVFVVSYFAARSHALKQS